MQEGHGDGATESQVMDEIKFLIAMDRAHVFEEIHLRYMKNINS